MKRLLRILLFIPIIGFSQYTSIPDQNFEQALIDLGYDNAVDGQVLTVNINGVSFLNVSSKAISDLTGIEDFTSLNELQCYSNQLTNLNVSQNTSLTHLYCNSNQLTNLDVSQNTSLTDLQCYSNQITNLDISQNTALADLNCSSNQLTSLDLRNGNNQNLLNIAVFANTALTCIHVDDVTFSNNNWTSIDAQHYFSTNCTNSVQEIPSSISIYPNPTNNLFQIEIENFNGSFEAELYTFTGKLLETTNKPSVSLADYPRGIYLLKVAYGGRVERLKVVKD